jgi:hydroxymethylbilane synthase
VDGEEEHQGRPGGVLSASPFPAPRVSRLIIATRKSPLAMAQTEMAAARLREALGFETELLRIVTTGDRQTEWSLEQRGGKGLFTSELEQALLRREADLAVHSTKDLPGDMPEGLEVAGYLPREDPRDVLVLREGVEAPRTVATGSPRRRLQLGALFPGAQFSEIRGNVDTRLRKIADLGAAEATVLAAAGLRRLGIASWPGVVFRPLTFEEMVPAVGQAAVALQTRAGEGARLAPALDAPTARQVNLERAFQRELGGGCHTAAAVHASGDTLHLFHERSGRLSFALQPADFEATAECARRILLQAGLLT